MERLREEFVRLVGAYVAAGRKSSRCRLPADLTPIRKIRSWPLLAPLPWEVDLTDPEKRLIVYGTLVPGGEYYYLLADLPEARWEPCLIRGHMGTYLRYPAFRWNPAGLPYPAWLVTSPGLPRRYPALDRFEGQAYRRRLIAAEAGRRLVAAYIYESRVRA